MRGAERSGTEIQAGFCLLRGKLEARMLAPRKGGHYTGDPNPRLGLSPTSDSLNKHLPGIESNEASTGAERQSSSMSWEEERRQTDNQEGAWWHQDTTASQERGKRTSEEPDKTAKPAAQEEARGAGRG